ncbi:MAG: ThuA domain-containing protein [Balneolaceae bacterium]
MNYIPQISPSSAWLVIPVVALSLILTAGCTSETPEAESRHVLFIAGAPSHGFGNHEHLGGSTLLAETIERADIGVTTEVISLWPEDPAVFDNADAVVIYSNGGNGHPAMGHLDELKEVLDRGVGFATLHYGVEVPPGEAGDLFLEWQGGYFETHWSVNPFWTARFEEYPEHPISNGVSPFEVRDEWYYHMRFTDGEGTLTPILSDLPPEESLSRDDGPHSGNPDVREAVLEREEPQHVAWAFERPNGGRGFGFTGGHYHWNWGVDEFRRLVVNAIVWTAGATVPTDGLPVHPVTILELSEMTDDPVPEDWEYQPLQEMLDEANGRTTTLE